MATGFVPDRAAEFRGKMSTRAIGSEDAAAAAELVKLVRRRPNDLVDP
jgi:hypothetical protein